MRSLRAALAATLCLLAAAPAAMAATNGTGGVSATPSGGVAPGQLPLPTQPAPTRTASPPARGAVARVLSGVAHAPHGAPVTVRRVIAAANKLQGLPYRYGGGHASFLDTAYDCSGSVSFALHGAGLLNAPLDSTGLAAWGLPGPGAWISVYANSQHAFMVVAGVRLDTSGTGGSGPRWRLVPRSLAGFTVRHPAGL